MRRTIRYWAHFQYALSPITPSYRKVVQLFTRNNSVRPQVCAANLSSKEHAAREALDAYRHSEGYYANT